MGWTSTSTGWKKKGRGEIVRSMVCGSFLVVASLAYSPLVFAQRRAAPATFFEPLPLIRAKEADRAAQEIIQHAADKDSARKAAAVKTALARGDDAKQKENEQAAQEAKAKAKATADAKAKAEALKAERAKEQEEALNAQAQQYIQLLQPTMWTELDFVRQNCDLKPEQRPKIKAAAEAAVKQAARDIGSPRLVAGAARIQRTQTGAAITIRNEVAKALKETVSPEEFARYSKEASARAAHRKEAAILSVVARLDALLCLSASQRDKMVESLAAGWQEDWEQWLQLQNYGGQYFPQIPDKHILSLLNAEQKSVWSGVQKINASSWSGNNGQARDTAWWEGKNE